MPQQVVGADVGESTAYRPLGIAAPMRPYGDCSPDKPPGESGARRASPSTWGRESRRCHDLRVPLQAIRRLRGCSPARQFPRRVSIDAGRTMMPAGKPSGTPWSQCLVRLRQCQRRQCGENCTAWPIPRPASQIGAKLPDRVENPVQAQAFFLERLCGGEDGFEIGLRILFAEEHHPHGESDLGIDHVLLPKAARPDPPR